MTAGQMCYCIGPQNGEPLCPCQMKLAKVYQERVDSQVEALNIAAAQIVNLIMAKFNLTQADLDRANGYDER